MNSPKGCPTDQDINDAAKKHIDGVYKRVKADYERAVPYLAFKAGVSWLTSRLKEDQGSVKSDEEEAKEKYTLIRYPLNASGKEIKTEHFFQPEYLAFLAGCSHIRNGELAAVKAERDDYLNAINELYIPYWARAPREMPRCPNVIIKEVLSKYSKGDLE